MLLVIPASNLDPWDYIFQNLIDEIPAGSTYFQGLEMMPRSVKAQDILLFTDNFVDTRIYVNNRLVRNFIPNGQVTRLKVHLFEPPNANNFVVVNGIDEPARLQVRATHQAAHHQTLAREIYNFAGYSAEKYWSSMQSPWATFFVEYQYPWIDLLPDLRELRILSVKMLANTLFGEFGTDGGVKDFISAFTVSTPAIIPAKNPSAFSPDLWNPVRSGDDISGFKVHVWGANICMSRWLAFITLLNNLDAFNLARVSEEVVMFRHAGTDHYEQHFFDPLGRECSILGLIDFLGCMDNITAAGNVLLLSTPTICFFANPFDLQVDLPGIGGTFLDEGEEFDQASHVVPDTVNLVATSNAVDQGTAIILATAIRIGYNAHDTDAVPTWHYLAGGSHQLTAAIPTDLISLRVFCIDAQLTYGAHCLDAGMHNPTDATHVLAYSITLTSTLAEVILFLNDFNAKFLSHQTAGHFDGIYDADLLTDYWVGTSTTNRFDSGGCLDTYNAPVNTPANTDCCSQGPDTKLLSTMVLEKSTTSAVTPIHPIFGGDDPGLLGNPYFAIPFVSP